MTFFWNAGFWNASPWGRGKSTAAASVDCVLVASTQDSTAAFAFEVSGSFLLNAVTGPPFMSGHGGTETSSILLAQTESVLVSFVVTVETSFVLSALTDSALASLAQEISSSALLGAVTDPSTMVFQVEITSGSVGVILAASTEASVMSAQVETVGVPVESSGIVRRTVRIKRQDKKPLPSRTRCLLAASTEASIMRARVVVLPIPQVLQPKRRSLSILEIILLCEVA